MYSMSVPRDLAERPAGVPTEVQDAPRRPAGRRAGRAEPSAARIDSSYPPPWVERPDVQSRETVSGWRAAGGWAGRGRRASGAAARRAVPSRRDAAVVPPAARVGRVVRDRPGPRRRSTPRVAGSPISSQAALIAAIRLGRVVAVAQVRVVLAGEPAIGGLDDLVLGLRVDLEDLVRVDVRHRCQAIRAGPSPIGLASDAAQWPPARPGDEPPEQVADDVAEGRRHRQGKDRPEQPRQRAADDDREHHGGRVQLDGVALDLRARGSCSRPAGRAVYRTSAATTATGPTVAASRTAGTAEMIGPMIGTSSRTPAMIDSRTRVAAEDRVDETGSGSSAR